MRGRREGRSGAIRKNRYNLPSANNRGLARARSIHLRRDSRESPGVFALSHYTPIEFAVVERDTSPCTSSNIVDIYFDCYDRTYDSHNKLIIIMIIIREIE